MTMVRIIAYDLIHFYYTCQATCIYYWLPYVSCLNIEPGLWQIPVDTKRYNNVVVSGRRTERIGGRQRRQAGQRQKTDRQTGGKVARWTERRGWGQAG